eukprot:35618-Eustigmatos_ZCMA.PRE.1
MPTIDLDENPFCIERQLADMEEQIQHNKKEDSDGEVLPTRRLLLSVMRRTRGARNYLPGRMFAATGSSAKRM